MPANRDRATPVRLRLDLGRPAWLSRARRRLGAVCRLPATPHQIALGAAVGAFVSVTPTPGVQMALAAGLAAATGGSIRAAVPMVWLSNPLTALPLLYVCYGIGQVAWPASTPVTAAELAAALAQTGFSAAGLLQLSGRLAAPLGIGGIVLGTLLAAVTYPAVRFLAEHHRVHRAQRRDARRMARRERRNLPLEPVGELRRAA